MYKRQVHINLEDIRPAGESLKGFGGRANPIKLKDLYSRVASLLAKSIGRKLNTVECCLLIDEAAVTIVAGNIRRSAGMRQFASDYKEAASAKENLWSQDENGNWRIDPEKDALRMANPIKLKDLYSRVASLLGKAIGRKLNTVECCLLIDEAAVTIVAGNIRRSAGMSCLLYTSPSPRD